MSMQTSPDFMDTMNGGKRRPMRKASPRNYHNKLMKHFGGFFEGEVMPSTMPMQPAMTTTAVSTGGKLMRVRRRSASPGRRIRRVGGEEMAGGKKKRPRRVRRVGGEEEMEGGKKKRPRRVRRVGGEEEMEGGKKKRPKRRSASPVRRRRVGGVELEGGKKKRHRRSASPVRRRRVGGEEVLGGKKKRPRRRSASPVRRR